jgi:hypothetical protein
MDSGLLFVALLALLPTALDRPMKRAPAFWHRLLTAVCFLLASSIVLNMAPVQAQLSHMNKPVAIALVALLFAAVGGGTYWFTGERAASTTSIPGEAPKPAEAQPPSGSPVAPAKPEIYTRYDRVGRIPTSAPQGQSELYVVRLSPDDGKGGLRIDEEGSNSPRSPDIYKCLVQNNGSVALQEIRLRYVASFFDGPKPDGSGGKSQYYTISIPPSGRGTNSCCISETTAGRGR